MSEGNSSKRQNVKVFIRVRPLDNSDSSSTISVEQDTLLTVTKPRLNDESKTYHFSKVFDEKNTQTEVYKNVASPIIERAFRGYNGTIFAYGQSGTGKTYTMFGELTSLNLKGIIPNVFSHIFTQISLENQLVSHTITVTFLEIYNEEVRDLLNDSQRKLDVREKPELGIYVKDLSGYTVESIDKVIEIISKGNKNRSTGSTKLNDKSSRSHAIFTVLVETKKEDGTLTFGKLNLVDLAGSERVSKSFATGDRLKEAGKINLSLSVLGNVISALIDGKTNYIPYRNSKLTRLLQDSLGGNSLTSMIATVSPEEADFEETNYTLMYADRVKHIKNCVKKNEENNSILKTFENKIKELQLELNALCQKPSKMLKLKNKQSKTSNKGMEKVEKEKKELLGKIEIIQKKILVGGENLVQKAQIQLDLLEYSELELKMLDSSQRMLTEKFETKKKEIALVERKSISLQEEDQLLDLQIEEAERKIINAKKLLFRKEREYQNEISYLLYTNKGLAKDIGLVNFVLKKYVPTEEIDKIKDNMYWDDEAQEWRMKFIAHCGNNMKNVKEVKEKKNSIKCNVKTLYRKYPKE